MRQRGKARVGSTEAVEGEDLGVRRKAIPRFKWLGTGSLKSRAGG